MKSMQNDMTVGNPMKIILSFTLPIFIGNVFQQFYNMADAVIVGKFVGNKALAAVGSTGTIMFLIYGFVVGMTAGFTVLTAQKFGAGDMKSMRKTVVGAGVLSFIVGALLTVLFMVFSNVFALALAVCLTKKLKIANVLRGVFFIPYIMSMTIVGFIWKFIFTQGFAKLYDITGWGVWNLSWLGDPKIAFFSVVMVGIWQSLGFYIVLYIAGLQALPTDVLEAAVVDGASNRQRFFKVTLPLLGPSITTCVFMSLTNGLKVFDIILALTKGGPGASTYSVTLQIYKEAFQNNHYGLGSAESIIYFLVVLVVTQFVLKLFSSREVEL